MEKTVFNCKMDKSLKDLFMRSCILEDLNGAQVMRALMKDFVANVFDMPYGEIDCEKTKNEQKEVGTKFQQACRAAQEEQSANDEGGLSNIEKTCLACCACGTNDQVENVRGSGRPWCKKCWNEYMRKS